MNKTLIAGLVASSMGADPQKDIPAFNGRGFSGTSVSFLTGGVIQKEVPGPGDGCTRSACVGYVSCGNRFACDWFRIAGPA